LRTRTSARQRGAARRRAEAPVPTSSPPQQRRADSQFPRPQRRQGAHCTGVSSSEAIRNHPRATQAVFPIEGNPPRSTRPGHHGRRVGRHHSPKRGGLKPLGGLRWHDGCCPTAIFVSRSSTPSPKPGLQTAIPRHEDDPPRSNGAERPENVLNGDRPRPIGCCAGLTILGVSPSSAPTVQGTLKTKVKEKKPFAIYCRRAETHSSVTVLIHARLLIPTSRIRARPPLGHRHPRPAVTACCTQHPGHARTGRS